MSRDVQCIIVHHKSLDTLWKTVRSLIAAGVNAENILVVDNGGSLIDRPTDLSSVRLLYMPNRGYGAAVNAGFRELQRSGIHSHVLVATHEVRVMKGKVGDLAQRLDEDPTLGVVGPALVDARAGTVWSLGGVEGRFLGIPGHRQHGLPLSEIPAKTLIPSSWLDGAFCLYRWEVLDGWRFDESFFLYFEENELHHRISKVGYRAGCYTGVLVAQTSDGIPEYYLGRNVEIFMRAQGTWLQRALTPLFVVLKRAIRIVLGGQGSLRVLLEGWKDGRRVGKRSVRG